MTRTHRRERGNLMRRIVEMVILCFMVCCIVYFLQPAAFSQQEGNSYVLSLPPGVLEPIIPEDNLLTKTKIDLGKKLFFDKRLSIDDTVSCATCHDPEKGFADGIPIAVGIKGRKGTRNSPTVLNAAFFDTQFWDWKGNYPGRPGQTALY